MHTLASIQLLSLSSLLLSPQRADIVFAGDAMQHQSQLDDALTSDGTYDYSEYFANVKDYISTADYAVVNLETPLGGAPYSGYPMFCAPDAYAHSLIDAGFDLMLTANNHTLDRRDRGLRRTLDALRSLGVPSIGTYRNAAQRDSILPFIRRINGFDVAFLNYTYGTNGIEIQGDVVVDYINRERIRADVDSARAAGAEIVAVCIHWGEEYQLLSNAAQRSLADYVLSLDVDMLIGGHPHVIQPMEIRTDDAGRRRLLVYSLGNFISGMRTTDTRGGAMVRVSLERDRLGRAHISDAAYRLVYTIAPGYGSRYRLVYAEEVADSSQMKTMAKDFLANATRIFNRHNVDVPSDTIFPRNRTKCLSI